MTFNSSQVGILTSIMVTCLGAFIAYRRYFSIHKLKSYGFDLFNYLIGMAFAISIAIVMFSWAMQPNETDYETFESDDEHTVVIDIPRTKHEKKKEMPKVELKKIIRPKDIKEIILIDEIPDQLKVTDNLELPIELPIIDTIVQKKITPPPVTPKIEDEEPLFLIIAEQMPRFPGCEELIGNDKEKEICSKIKLLNYIKNNLTYPKIARENSIEGVAIVQFIVNENGEVEAIDLKRDIPGGCGKAAVKVVETMNSMEQRWTPGKQRGRTVKVLYTLPIKFRLN